MKLMLERQYTSVAAKYPIMIRESEEFCEQVLLADDGKMGQ